MSAAPSPIISILGGGVSGITAGIVVQLLGGQSHLYAAHRADTAWGSHRPQMASLYPAASVIPHRVTVGDVTAHMRDTQACFEVLRRSGTCGVRLQRHFEVFETPPSPPDYADAVHAFRMLPDDGSGGAHVPRRPGAEAVFGWTFQAYVVETPTYLRRLFALYQMLGGRITTRLVSADTLPDVPGEVLVNALGAGSRSIFPDSRPAAFLRGCLLLANPPRPVTMPGPVPLASYNYTPSASVYPTATGDAGGLYLYPRTDTWVLGGSARPGTLTDAGDWSGAPLAGPTCTVDGQAIPQAVLETNAAIIRNWAGVDIRRWPMRATYGIRYVRDPEGDGVRLDVTSAHGRRVVHCHGHGGAGVTLSWSSALRVARRLRSEGGLLPAPDRVGQPAASALLPADAVLVRRLFQQVRTRLQE